MTIRPALLFLAFLATASFSQADLLKKVPSASLAKLAAGQQVVQAQNVPGAPWPRAIIYQVVNAPSTVVWNLFTDYDAAPSYTPDLLSAKVLTQNANGNEVQYTIRVPVIQRATYTVQNTYVQHKRQGAYQVDWTLLKSPLAKSSDGSLRIQPYGNNQTLMCYTNLCVPITSLLAGLKNQALTAAENTVAAIKTEAEKRAAAGQN